MKPYRQRRVAVNKCIASPMGSKYHNLLRFSWPDRWLDISSDVFLRRLHICPAEPTQRGYETC
jgi:hypothetical protein